jgi:hypothetical protein
MLKSKIVHYPSLKTILMVEECLKKANTLIKREELKRRLKKKIMHQTLNLILDYLAKDNKILDGRKGIIWIHNNSKRLDQAIKNGTIM